DDHHEDGERERRRQHAAGAVAAGEEDGGEPDRQRAEERPQPGPVDEGAQVRHRPHPSRRLMMARAASTMIRMAPLAPTCQSGGICMKVSSGEAASARVSAPMTAPIGDTRPPTNSPPPRITPAIDSSV